MFKRTAFHVQMVKPLTTDEAPEPVTPFQIQLPTHQQIKDATLLLGAAYTTKVVLDTAREVALLLAKSKLS